MKRTIRQHLKELEILNHDLQDTAGWLFEEKYSVVRSDNPRARARRRRRACAARSESQDADAAADDVDMEN